jgi:hypothetical protein
MGVGTKTRRFGVSTGLGLVGWCLVGVWGRVFPFIKEIIIISEFGVNNIVGFVWRHSIGV